MADRGTHLHIVEKAASQTGAANSETLIALNLGVIYYDCGGASRTGVILEAGVEDGEVVRVVNASDAAETITFAAAGTSNVAGGTGIVIGQNEHRVFVWSASLETWVPHNVIGTADIADGAVTTAKLADDAVTSAKLDEGVIQVATVELTATEIVGTDAGDIGHTAGAVLVAAPGADKALEFISAVLSYTFDTAAYTGGDDDNVIRQGTTAVSAAIAGADLLEDTEDDIAFVSALSAADLKLTKNSTLNLKGTALTQPGTAAGTLSVRIAYRVHDLS